MPRFYPVARAFAVAGAFAAFAAFNVGATIRTTDPPGACKQSDSSFATADGGCKDLVTGRVWSASGYDQTGNYHSLSGSQAYCANLVEGGFDDWRQPTEDELLKVHADGGGSYLAPSNLYITYDWSSTLSKNKRNAYVVIIGTGATFLAGLTDGFDTVCVR